MLFTTLFKFALSALLYSSTITARPVQDINLDVQNRGYSPEILRRTQFEVDVLEAMLMRRTRDAAKKGSVAAASAGGAAKSSNSVVALCKAQRKKRELEGLLLFPRARPFEELDPEGKHRVTKTLGVADGVGNRIDGGSSADIRLDPTDPKMLIKHIWNSNGNNIDPGEVIREMEALQAVKQVGDPIKYKYRLVESKVRTVTMLRLQEAWIWMKRVDGDKFNNIVTKFTDAAKRKVFIDKVVELLDVRAVQYAKTAKYFHVDMTAENVLIVMKGDTVESVDLIDWGNVDKVDCTPDTEAAIKQAITKAFERFY